MKKPGPDFISLIEAEKYCPYSADYLKLRARQGKLKAQKSGRFWFTKKSWVKEYVKEVDNYWDRRRKKDKEAIKEIVKKREGKKRFSFFSFRRLSKETTPLFIVLLLFSLAAAIILSKDSFFSCVREMRQIAINAGGNKIFDVSQIYEKVARDKAFALVGNGILNYSLLLEKDGLAYMEGLTDLQGVLQKNFLETIEGAENQFNLLALQFQEYLGAMKSFKNQLSFISFPDLSFTSLALAMDNSTRIIEQKSQELKNFIVFSFQKTAGAEFFDRSSAAKINGITLYDEATGEPYCLKIRRGKIFETKGECGRKN